MRNTFLLLAFLYSSLPALSQPRWQQRADYRMEVRLDVQAHRLSGNQVLTYTNHSPDTLTKLFYHLYWNAFQPGSMMDVRSRTISDPDRRVLDRIQQLKPHEIGYQQVRSLLQDGQPVSMQVTGTLLDVRLPKAILPGQTTTLEMTFEAQVPLQIRRSGRDNREGIAYSMTQWYPKVAEYDHQGWHPYQYVAREFHAPWGDYDVTIEMPVHFVVAGTGVLQNKNEIGHGYEDAGVVVKRDKKQKTLRWRFLAPQVIDFAWAADPDYQHDRIQVPDGPELHFFYQPGEKTRHWKELPPLGVALFQFMNREFGAYPYTTYSVIQGGDGGMEYPMCTLILGEGGLAGTTSVMVHEVAHSWFQMVLASNEALYAWMDEGFTSFAQNEALAFILNRATPNAQASVMQGYAAFVKTGKDEAAALHSDFYGTNRAYTASSYTKGAIMLTHLRYLMGPELFGKAMRRYYQEWKFRHPEPHDFTLVMEKTSGLQLKWHYQFLINSTKTIDYAVGPVVQAGNRYTVTLQRLGEFPMPVEVTLTYADGSTELVYIPLNETLGTKPLPPGTRLERTWFWTEPSYRFEWETTKELVKAEVDKHQQTADVNRENNQWTKNP